MYKVIAFGEALVDMLSNQCGTKDVQQEEFFTKYPGGAPANVAAGVAKLGGRSYFLGMLGQDMFGDFMHRSLLEMGVADDYIIKTDAANTALAFVSRDAQGERSFSFYRNPGADMLLRAEHIREQWFEEPAVFHFCSNSMTEQGIADTTFYALQKAKTAQHCISFDINLRANLWPPDRDPIPLIWRAIEQCDILKLSVEEMQALLGSGTENDVLKRVFDGGVSLVLLTDGAATMRYFVSPRLTPTAKCFVTPPSIDTVDSTAAGDAFCAGLLFQLARQQIGKHNLAEFCRNQHKLQQALYFACQCGAHAASKPGAFNSLPALNDVEDTL